MVTTYSKFRDSDYLCERPDLLEKFRELNPCLTEADDDTGRCEDLWNLLIPQHRFDKDCCHRMGGWDRQEVICFLDHAEFWKHKETGMPVLAAHPYCRHEDLRCDHRGELEFLAERGLWYKVSDASWYHAPRSSLIVVARVDLLDGISMPWDDPEGVKFQSFPPDLDWKRIEAEKLAEEAGARRREMRLVQRKKREGRLNEAVQMHLDIAEVDRASGLNSLAREQLDEAKRLLEEHPDLRRGELYFQSDENESYVLGCLQEPEDLEVLSASVS